MNRIVRFNIMRITCNTEKTVYQVSGILTARTTLKFHEGFNIIHFESSGGQESEESVVE
jgi:hypothetical protein